MRNNLKNRKINTKKQKETILIVCEGKTEVRYFQDIAQSLRRSVTVKTCDKGTCPLQNVEECNKKCNGFDKIFAVFDRDAHPRYDEAIKKANEKVEIIDSNPCFELWLVLHFENMFEYCLCKDVTTKLESYIKDYKKGKSVYNEIKSKTDTAVLRATQLQNLHTKIGDLVNLLKKPAL